MVATSQIGRKLARKRALKTFEEAIVRPRLTGAQAAAQIVKSGAFGAWKDRTDITNSSEYARELRRQAETRDTLPVMEPTADVVTKRSGGVTVYSSTSGKTGTKLGGGEQTITRTESSIPGVQRRADMLWMVRVLRQTRAAL